MHTMDLHYDAESLRFALWLCANNILSPSDAFAALQMRASQKPKIGKVAMMMRLLTVAQSMDVLEQQTVMGTPYGETAVRLGFITREQLGALLRAQCEATPALIDVLVNDFGYQRPALLNCYDQFAAGTADAISTPNALVPSSHAAAFD